MMKKRFLAALLAALTLLALTACGGGSSSSSSSSSGSSGKGGDSGATMDMTAESMTEPMENGFAGGAEYDGGAAEEAEDAGGTDSALAEQKFIITARMELETTGFDEAVQGLAQLVEDFDGYFESSSVANRVSGSRWADYTARIPAERYESFMNQAGALCHETWREASKENITEAYYDTAGRLKTQQIKLERLQALLARAELMEDIITIESAISETEWMIDELSGTLRRYDGKVDYATIYLSLREVYKLSDVEQVPDSFSTRLSAAFSDGMRAFSDNLENLMVGLAYTWMWWLLVIVIAVVVIVLARRKLAAARASGGEKPPVWKRKDKKQDDNRE